MLVGSGLFLFLWIVLWIWAFVEALLSDPTRVRAMPKIVWVILILIFSGFAAIAWFIFGRPRAGDGTPPTTPGARFSTLFPPRPSGGSGGPSASSNPDSSGWQLGGTGGRRRAGPVAPDDDPEFLRSLGNRRRGNPEDEQPPT